METCENNVHQICKIGMYLYSMTQLSGAHAFRQFLRQLSTDFHEILHRTFPVMS